MLKVPHQQCEAHKYIRVGGGYRHSYSYLKALMEELQHEMREEELRRERLEAIKEASVRAVKTYIRTNSGRLVERIVFMSEDDYAKFTEAGGANAADILRKYLSKDEGKNLASWDKEEVKAIKTFVRTKSGRLKEQLVYVSKSDYDKIKTGGLSAGEAMSLLKKYVKVNKGETLDGWSDAQMRQVKTMVRTQSGRLVEKMIMVSKEEYEELQRLEREGGDPSAILAKYVGKGEKVESWKKASEGRQMKVVKTFVRTRSGRLIEKDVMLTEDEYNQFMASGGDKELLKKYMNLTKGETIENWEKASTVYEASDDGDGGNANVAAGTRVVGADGNVYEYVVDPITGKKYKKKVGAAADSDADSGIGTLSKSKTGKSRADRYGGGISEEEYGGDAPTREERKKYKAMKEGVRNKDSDSEYSYTSEVSAGGTRHVKRRRKRADGTRSAAESYHSSQDEGGKARRRQRRRERRHGADSAHSYFSVVSAGGTRHVRRRKKRADGTYSDSESYHSAESVRMRKKKRAPRQHGSDSEYSYFSEVSAGGTRTRKRKKRLRDAQGKVIGHASSEAYSSSSYDSDESSYETIIDEFGRKIRKKKPSKGSERGKGKKKRELLGKTRSDFVGGFSDASTDTEDEPDLDAMTEEERRQYLEAKAKRQAEREKRRREKYGDKYEEIMAQHEENKKQLRKERALKEGLAWDSDEYDDDPDAFKKKYKSLVTYEKGASRGLDPEGKRDGREPGLGHEAWADGKKGGKKGARGAKDGFEADDEGEGPSGDNGGRKKGKKGKTTAFDADSDGESFIGEDGRRKKKTMKGKDEVIESDYEYEYEYDEQGRIKKKKKKYHDGDSGSEYEYEYDEYGNVTRKKVKEGKKDKKHVVRKGSADSDGDYFEKGPDGQIRLKAGKKKIDISKLTADDLRALGIDPTLSKQEIARKLKEKFGEAIRIEKGGEKIGLRGAEDYGSEVGTDELADDSDLDTSTLKPGRRRVNILMKKGGIALLDQMKHMIDESSLADKPVAGEVDASIDYLQHYRLVDHRKLDSYARAFVVEDDDRDFVIAYKDARGALEGVPSIEKITKKQMDYVLKCLNIDENTRITFRMFSVVTALCERVTKMDLYSKDLLEIANMADIERKLELYRAIFYCNASSDRDPNYIKCESLMIELIAGGLSWQQQDYIMKQLQPNEYREVSFIDYLCYIPLFLSMHDGICFNPLDMGLNKYPPTRRVDEQRDMNPLGHPLKRTSAFMMRQRAEELLTGKKPDVEQARKEHGAMLATAGGGKYSRLPEIIGTIEKRPTGAPRYF